MMSTVATSGTWPAISVSPPSLEGLTTDNVKWGTPAGGADKSGYKFAGGSVDVLLDGTEFVLGTITHQNFPITGMPQNQFDVDLGVRVLFEDGIPHGFSFRFQHNESPQRGPQPRGPGSSRAARSSTGSSAPLRRPPHPPPHARSGGAPGPVLSVRALRRRRGTAHGRTRRSSVKALADLAQCLLEALPLGARGGSGAGSAPR